MISFSTNVAWRTLCHQHLFIFLFFFPLALASLNPLHSHEHINRVVDAWTAITYSDNPLIYTPRARCFKHFGHQRRRSHLPLASKEAKVEKGLPPNRPRAYIDPEVSSDTLKSRYRRAMNDSVGSPLNTAETIEKKLPPKSTENALLSSTNDSEFDWNESNESEIEESERKERDQPKLGQMQDLEHTIRHAKRLRRLYLFLMQLSSPVRTTIIGFLASGIAITLSRLFLFG